MCRLMLLKNIRDKEVEVRGRRILFHLQIISLTSHLSLLNIKYMNLIKDLSFGGERPLFESHNLRMENIIITDGESGVKECSDIEAHIRLF